MQKKYLRGTASAIALALIAFGVPQLAFAQEGGQQAAALGEIVVTARKVEENLMEVPVAISALGAQQLQSLNVKDLSTLSLYTPGLWADRGIGNFGRQLTFRGLSPASGQYFLDGAPYAGGLPSFNDLERVEVLVGPQSAYFGRSTFTGALNFVTKDPSNSFGGSVRADAATYNTYDASVSFEGPIIKDKLMARVTAQRANYGGQWRAFTHPEYKLGQQETTSLMATVVALPTSNLTIRANAVYVLEDATVPKTINLIGANPNPRVIQSLRCNLGGTFGPYHCGALPTADELPPSIISANGVIPPEVRAILYDRFSTQVGTPTLFDRYWKPDGGNKQLTTGGTLKVDYDLNGWTLNSTTSFFRNKTQSVNWFNYRDDRGLVPNPLFGVRPDVLPFISIGPLMGQNIIKTLSQEVRVTTPSDWRLRGTAGFNYLKITSPGSTNNGFTPTVVGLITGIPTATKSSTPAIFGGVYFDILPEVTLGAEARYQWDTLSRNSVLSGTPLQAIPGPVTSSLFKSFSPRLTVDWNYAQNSVIYGLWSRGYRPGGFNNSVLNATPSVLAQLAAYNAGPTFAQEKLDNYEVGWKSTLFNGRVQVATAAYYQQWRDGQIPNVFVIVGANGAIDNNTLVTNVGAVDLYGFEGSGAWLVNDNLTINATINYQTSDIKKYVYTPAGLRVRNSTQVTGNKFQNGRDWTWTLSPTYTDDLGDDWQWFIRGDWKYKGKYFVDPTNVAWIDPANLFDLRLGIRKDTLTVEVYGLNLTDNMQPLGAQRNFDDQLCCAVGATVGPSNVNAIQYVLPDRRQFGVRFIYGF
jgi:iron complex outermembrane receptor protein